MDNMNQGTGHYNMDNMNQGTGHTMLVSSSSSSSNLFTFLHRRTTIVLSFFKLYMQQWTTELNRITAGSCLTLSMMPCTRFQGHKTVKNVETWIHVSRGTSPGPLKMIHHPEDTPQHHAYARHGFQGLEHEWMWNIQSFPKIHWANPSCLWQLSSPWRATSQEPQPLHKVTYLNMNDVAEDGFFKALSEIVDWASKSLACVHGQCMIATSHDAWGTNQDKVPYGTLGPKTRPRGVPRRSVHEQDQCSEMIENFTQSERCLACRQSAWWRP